MSGFLNTRKGSWNHSNKPHARETHGSVWTLRMGVVWTSVEAPTEVHKNGVGLPLVLRAIPIRHTRAENGSDSFCDKGKDGG